MFIELGGKNRRIRFDYNALADLEQMSGTSIQKLFSDTGNIGFNFIRMLVWAGLKSSEPGLTVQRAGALINQSIEAGTSLDVIAKTFMEELSKSSAFGKKEEGSDDEKNV